MPPEYIPAQNKMANMLFDCGFRKVEVTSFVHPKAAPQMKDAVEVLSALGPGGSQRIRQVLVPNETGCRSAIACKSDEIAVSIFLSDRLSYSTLNRSVAETLKRISTICEIRRKRGKDERVPGGGFWLWEKTQALSNSSAMVAKLVQLGCRRVCLNDELAMANPVTVREHLRACMAEVDAGYLAAHFYDNRGMGLANVFAAYESGVRVFKSSLGGAGLHGYLRSVISQDFLGAIDPHGLATEDIVYGFEEMGITTGIDIDRLIGCGRFLEKLLGTRCTVGCF